jgi:hypothetical protein
MLHIRHIFLHPSLSDSNLQFGNRLNAQIPALLQGIEREPRAKIAAGQVDAKPWSAIMSSIPNHLARSVFTEYKVRNFSRYDNPLWPAVCIEGIILLDSHQKSKS